MVCAQNMFYDYNPKAFIEYRNYYNEIAGRFDLEDNKVCLELAKFIENMKDLLPKPSIPVKEKIKLLKIQKPT